MRPRTGSNNTGNRNLLDGIAPIAQIPSNKLTTLLLRNPKRREFC